jgi:hypothetical protein
MIAQKYFFFFYLWGLGYVGDEEKEGGLMSNACPGGIANTSGHFESHRMRPHRRVNASNSSHQWRLIDQDTLDYQVTRVYGVCGARGGTFQEPQGENYTIK